MSGCPSVRFVLKVAVAGLVASTSGCGDDPPRKFGPKPAGSVVVNVEPRTPILPTYPCSGCHADRPPNPKKRLLKDFHTVRNKELHHGNAKGWCYHCHSVKNIDRLMIADGSLVTFDQAYLLCGGCHGDRLRDWRLGAHGLTKGGWTGPKLRRSCTGCHSPHRPKFKRMHPQPPPVPPVAAP